MPHYYKIQFPVEVPGVKKRWIRIGSATSFPLQPGPGTGIACRIESVPLNWNGEFYLFPSENPVREETE